MKIPTCLAVLSLLANLSAQPPPSPPEARQFDFWLGEWEVFSPAGTKEGENRIEPVAGGRGLLEHWSGSDGTTGESLNAWVARTNQWQQLWVGPGGVLELAGGLNASGEMVLAGRTTGREGKVRLNRITWTPNPDGTVRQHWQGSTDGGTTWTTVFDGLYRRKPR